MVSTAGTVRVFRAEPGSRSDPALCLAPFGTPDRVLDRRSRPFPVGRDRSGEGKGEGRQQTRRLSSFPADLADAYPLWGLLRCVCGRPCDPVLLVDGSRAYRSVCGCRLSAIDAATVECLVYNAAQRQIGAPLAETSAMKDSDLAHRAFGAIVVAGTVDDLSFVLAG
ncbi:hypothetical protein O7623_22985 [Solwaraspora sp. WMMD791]|uniref:hypothetical protein n=1 Tax=Solwaraspora sp. WMMD791 TaxID=3016086 RepID=UPI00249B8757|nr:hypothetical protein [Solwaraspora sp. WMMD791]WFE26193.1 hypothetical protein O7623_22985 [Solwaraspora sp. WMMD791]